MALKEYLSFKTVKGGKVHVQDRYFRLWCMDQIEQGTNHVEEYVDFRTSFLLKELNIFDGSS